MNLPFLKAIVCVTLLSALPFEACGQFISSAPGNAVTTHITVTGSGNAPPKVLNLFPGPVQLHTSGLRTGLNGDYELSDAFAETEGVFLPTITPTHFAGLGRATSRSYAEDKGGLFLGAADSFAAFDFEVGLSGPAGMVAPVIIDLVGNASTTLGAASSGSARSRAVGRQIHFSGVNDTPLFDFNTNLPPYGNSHGGSFGTSVVVNMESGDLVHLLLEAQSSVRSGGGPNNVETALAMGMVDPTFTIDPSFPDRHLFSLTMSPNLLPVPEPGPLVLFAVGLAALFGIARSKKRFVGR